MAGYRLGIRNMILWLIAGALLWAIPGIGRAQNTTFSFGAAGDYGDTENTQATLDQIAASGVQFHLALGDLSYNGMSDKAIQDWCNFVKSSFSANFPFQLLAGNHEDAQPQTGSDGYIDKFASCLPNQISAIVPGPTPPGAVSYDSYAKSYYFDYPENNPTARIFMISPYLEFYYNNTSGSTHTYTYASGTADYDWLVEGIDEAKASGLWVIVGMHKPCLTIGKKNCEIEPDLMNLLIEKRVDLVLQGHDHNYQRSKQLAHSSTCSSVPVNAFDPDCVVSDDTYGNIRGYSRYRSLVRGAGTVFVISGAGGHLLYPVYTSDLEARYFASSMGSTSNPTFGFVKFTVSDTQISGTFVSSGPGSFCDNFTISPASPASPADGFTAYVDLNAQPGDCNSYNVLAIIPSSTDPNVPIDPTIDWKLKDFATGAVLGVTMRVDMNVRYQTTNGADSAPGTAADNLFGGIVDGVGGYEIDTVNSYSTVTFDNLNPTKEYVLAVTYNRNGGTNYTDRVTKFTLSGTDSDATYLPVSFNTGDNTANGYVAQWTGITAADGSFSILSEHFGGPKAYGMTSIRLQETAPSEWSAYKLTVSHGAPFDDFGRAVAMYGDTAIVGAWGVDVPNNGSGSAYIFQQENGNWELKQELKADDAVIYERFGYAVSLSGDTAVIGAPGKDKAYIFRRENGVWQQVEILVATDGKGGDNFGESVGISGDTVVIGAYREGAAYIFKENNGSWPQIAKLSSDDGNWWGFFGDSVGVSGDTVIVGAPYEYNSQSIRTGVAYIFKPDGNGVWQRYQKLTVSDGEADDEFGRNVAISGSTAIVSSHRDDDLGWDAGSAYIYKEEGGIWQEKTKLKASDGAETDMFGHSVAISGDTVVVGTALNDEVANNAGAAYIFGETAGNWTQLHKVTADDGDPADDWFGSSVGLFGNVAIVGAYGDGPSWPLGRVGAAWIVEFNKSAPAGFTSYIDLNAQTNDNNRLNVRAIIPDETNPTVPIDPTIDWELKDFATGTVLGVTMWVDMNVRYPTTNGADSAPGTTADNLFGGIVDGVGGYEIDTINSYSTVTFDNLNPTKEYVLAVTYNRNGGTNYTDRVTKFTLSGTDSDATYLPVSFNTGDNTANGYVAQWTGITAADGSFSITAKQDTSCSGCNGRKAYAMTAVMLQQLP